MENQYIIKKLKFAEGFYHGAWESIPRKMKNNFPLYNNKILSNILDVSFAPSETSLTRTCEKIQTQINELSEIIKSDLSHYEFLGNLRDCLKRVVGDIKSVLRLMKEKDNQTNECDM